jgi:hypothetical protein
MAGSFGVCYYVRVGAQLERYFGGSSYEAVATVQQWCVTAVL